MDSAGDSAYKVRPNVLSPGYNRPMPRFSLRTLLVVMLLACCWAAWMGCAYRIAMTHHTESERLFETNWAKARQHKALRDTYYDAAFRPWDLFRAREDWEEPILWTLPQD